MNVVIKSVKICGSVIKSHPYISLVSSLYYKFAFKITAQILALDPESRDLLVRDI